MTPPLKNPGYAPEVYLKESFCEFILGLLAVIVVKSPGTQIQTE